MDEEKRSVTCTAPVNIAVIKYCGCRVGNGRGCRSMFVLCGVCVCLCVCVRGVISGGKRDEELVLPVNSSLSVTLSQEQVSRHAPPPLSGGHAHDVMVVTPIMSLQLRTVTTVCLSRQFEKDRIWVNGRSVIIHVGQHAHTHTHTHTHTHYREESMDNPRLNKLLSEGTLHISYT